MNPSPVIRCIAYALACKLLLTAAPGLAADGIQVETNQAKIVKLPQAADTVIVGNPEIADVAVQDDRTIVITGKGFGVTNLVVLTREGTAIVDQQITVSRQTVSTLRVYRRADVQTLSCTPFCEAAYASSSEARSDASMGAQ
ncbi:MAG: pilus assembly protein N-terminal domain-containing protein [Rhizobiaceae bacterium]|nr:pilus assembly protein N-terminal domain-containing protein [Rhizobiaceae bacterium]